MPATSGDSSARAWTHPAIAGGLLAVAGTALVTRRPALDLVTLVPDDAYFYLKTIDPRDARVTAPGEPPLDRLTR